MASSFPSVIATLTYPQPNQPLNAPSHSSIHGATNDEIIQIETVIGTTSSAVGTIQYDLRSPNSSGGGHVQTAAKGGTGQTAYALGDLLVGQNSSTLSRLAVGANSNALLADSSQPLGVRWGSSGKFGGTGADGALNVTSGTTTISLSSVVTFIKNYSSINITGTGLVNFTSPNTNGTVIILKSTGNVTLTGSMSPALDASGMGAAGGPSISGTSGGSQTPGNGGARGVSLNGWITSTMGGLGSGAGTTVGGTRSSILSNFGVLQSSVLTEVLRYQYIVAGAGGASGNGTSSNTQTYQSGSGGNGGPVLIIECGGVLNFTSGISASGQNGLNGVLRAGGGAGGGSGIVLVYANSILSATGSVFTLGGIGGVPNTSVSGGGGGASMINDGQGGNTTNAGNGGNGFSTVALNDTFA